MFVLSLGALSFAASSRHAEKFERMLDGVTLPRAAIPFVDSPKQRALFRGVAAAVEQPLIKDAFCIVYEDLGPVRVAGDLIFNQLASVAKRATQDAAVAGDVDALAAMATHRTLFRLVDTFAEWWAAKLGLDLITEANEDEEEEVLGEGSPESIAKFEAIFGGG